MRSFVVALLSAQVDYIAGVQDKIWLAATQQSSHGQLALPPLPLSPTTAKGKPEFSPTERCGETARRRPTNAFDAVMIG
jgi:hypothetical protein